MTRLARWIVVLVALAAAIVMLLSLLAIYRAPLTISDLVGPQFALGFICGGCSLALIFLIGDWVDAGDSGPEEDG